MIINQSNLQNIYKGFSAIFNKELAENKPIYKQIAMEVNSSSRETTYAWLGNIPNMREWIGDRVIQNLQAHTYTLKNKDFEVTISVPRNDIADDNIGIYKPIVQEMGCSMVNFPDTLVFELLSKSFIKKCYDGEPMISDNHPLNTGKLNPLRISNKLNLKLDSLSYSKARAMMMSFKGESGKPLRLVPDLLVVSPQNEDIARKIAYSEIIDGTTNPYKGTVEVFVVHELADNPDYWFLMCTTRAIKPFIFQMREKPKLIGKDNPTDDNVFFNKEFIYGADCRCNAGYGLWQTIIGSTGENTPQA